jgi:hypothetical protein
MTDPPSPSAAEAVDPENPWGTFLNVLCGPLERFDVHALATANRRPWYNQTFSRVNDGVMRVGVIRGDYPWHRHDDEDELFYVVEGGLELDVEPLPHTARARPGRDRAAGRTASAASGHADDDPHGRGHRGRADWPLAQRQAITPRAPRQRPAPRPGSCRSTPSPFGTPRRHAPRGPLVLPGSERRAPSQPGGGLRPRARRWQTRDLPPLASGPQSGTVGLGPVWRRPHDP